MPELSDEILINEKEIAKRVEELAREISNDQGKKPITIICILKGSFMFVADLVRSLTCPVKMEFIRVLMTDDASDVPREIRYNVPFNVKNEDVLMVEDIFDTGITLDFLLEHFNAQKPKSIKICTLLDKERSHKVDVEVDYVGFRIPQKYVVGYGLDYEENYRELPYITWLEGVEWPL